MNAADTIAAVSSAVGPAARMVVRVSGPHALTLAGSLCGRPPDELPPASRVVLHFAGLALPAWLYVFRAPRSYTGENGTEFHVPGNPTLARLLLEHLHAAGARPAEPGEFTARAFFHGRIGLTEAEGVAATIAAGNEQELAAARQLLAGELARRLRPAADLVAETLALVEAGIDFSDEDVTFLTPAQVRIRAADADGMLQQLLDQSTRFERLSHEPTAVLVGRPNAGKSTLLNALAGHERAVTSPVSGTTRDALSAEVALPRGVLRVVDAAGISPAGPATPTGGGPRGVPGPGATDVDRQMREQALRAVSSADFVLLVHAADDEGPRLTLSRDAHLVVRTKSDLVPEGAPNPREGELWLSAATGANLPALRDRLDRLAFGDAATAAGAALALNARHVEAVGDARAALGRAAGQAEDGPAEVVALELRSALDAVGRVLGAVTPDDLLGRIFSTFCIGK